MMRKCEILFLVVLLVFCTSCTTTDITGQDATKSEGAPPGFKFGSDQTLIHLHSGAIFQDSLSEYVRKDTFSYDNAGKDVSVTYWHRLYPIIATIYVYPTYAQSMNEDVLKEGFTKCKNELEMYRKNAQLILENEYELIIADNTYRGLMAIYTFDEVVKKSEYTFVSYIFQFGKNDWFIAYRISQIKSKFCCKFHLPVNQLAT